MEQDIPENNDIINIINQISSFINQPEPRIRIIPNILFSNLIINDPTNIINRSFEEKNDIIKPMCKEFKEGLKKIKINEEDDISCAICQDKFKMGENVIVLPCKEGGHFFHFEEGDCPGIYPWMEVNNTCPVCRCEFPMEPEAEPEPGAEPEQEAEPEPEDESENNLIIEDNINNIAENILNNYFERVFDELEDRELDEAIRRSLDEQ